MPHGKTNDRKFVPTGDHSKCDEQFDATSSRSKKKGRLPPLPAVPAPDRRPDEIREERMRTRRPGLQLPVKLSPEVPGMLRQLDDLHEVPPAADPGDPEPPRLQPLPIRVVELIAVTMTFADLQDAVAPRRQGPGFEVAGVGPFEASAAHKSGLSWAMTA